MKEDLWGKYKGNFVACAESYKGVGSSISLYWEYYGGWSALISSPYLHASILITILLCWPAWACGKGPWYDISCSALPNLLGLSLAGYAILMSLGSDKFLKLIAGKFGDNKPSPFMEANGAFVHFVVVQVLALVVGFVGKIAERQTGAIAFFGVLLFVYSLSLGMASAFAVLNIGDWREIQITMEQGENKDDASPPTME